MEILKVLSHLLTYPEQDTWDHKQELIEASERAQVLSAPSRLAVVGFIQQLTDQNLMEAQEIYGNLFDRGRQLSFLLFEHVHGESRDRGQAMVDLMGVYQQHGFEIDARELPDYIPLFLEYLSQRPETEIRDWLGEVAHILATLSTRLRERESPYAVLFDALLELTVSAVDLDSIREQVAKEQRDDTPAAIDKVWEEEAIQFGGDSVSGGCPSQFKPKQTDPNAAQPLAWVDVSYGRDQLNRAADSRPAAGA